MTTASFRDEPDLVYAGFWLRLWASMIDSILLMVLLVPMIWAYYGSARLDQGVEMEGAAKLFFGYLLPALLVLLFWRRRGATPGKMVIRAEIVDAHTGQPTTLRQDVVRYLGYFLSAIFLGLGFLWVAFDRRKQGWHDKLAGTVVVRRPAAEKVRFED